MSQESVEVVRKAFAAGPGEIRETALAYWDPEVEYVEDPRWPGASRYKGRADVLRCWEAYIDELASGGEVAATVERVFGAGEQLVPFVRVRGRSPSGVPHEHLWAYLVEVRSGRIVRFRAYYQPEEALEAAGLT
jgi:ketosteroid isomerase-like protein